MLDFSYYVVTFYVDNFPYFTTCTVIDDVFYRIEDLSKFLSDGKSGISDEKVIHGSFKLVTSQHFSI